MFKIFNKKIILALISMTLIIGVMPTETKAVFVPVNTVVESSPTAIKRTSDTTMLQVKNYVLDGLAWTVAKIMLQQITASVVNWINSGFQGSPAFLTDPGAFFADAADQITGDFIAKTGALAELCSPFSIDIRLSLALGGQFNTHRYACTLSTLINNAKNSKVSVGGAVTYNGQALAGGGASASVANGASIDGFVAGDFSQGGWPAFMAMTTQPQNNIYGAYLQAKSDLEQQIANRQNNIRVDLAMGNGFMSWKKCSDVNIDDQAYFDDLGVNSKNLKNAKGNVSINTGQDYYSGSDYSLQKKVDPKTGKASYKDCKTETPGSVIAGSINKALGVPQDTLNIAGSLNQIVGALFAQLVTKVLSGGLHSASSNGSNYTAGVATQLVNDRQNLQITASRDQLAASAQGYYSTASTYLDLRKQAYDTVSITKNSYVQARQCFVAKTANTSPSNISTAFLTYGQNQIAAIQAAEVKVNTVVSQYSAKLNDANTRLAGTQDIINDINSSLTSAQLQAASTRFNTAVQGGSPTSPAFVTPSDVLNAQSDLTFAQDQVIQYNKEAAAFQQACNNFVPAGAF